MTHSFCRCQTRGTATSHCRRAAAVRHTRLAVEVVAGVGLPFLGRSVPEGVLVQVQAPFGGACSIQAIHFRDCVNKHGTQTVGKRWRPPADKVRFSIPVYVWPFGVYRPVISLAVREEVFLKPISPNCNHSQKKQKCDGGLPGLGTAPRRRTSARGRSCRRLGPP